MGEMFLLRNTMITEFEVPANAVRVGLLPITLEKVSFRGATKEIYEGAFEGTQITSIVLPDGMERINKEAFYNCAKLVSVTLPDSLFTIGDNVFAECTSLESINLPMRYLSIGEAAFKNCSSLKNVTIPDSIPDSLVGKKTYSIDGSAFEGCLSLSLATQAQLKKLGYTWGNSRRVLSGARLPTSSTSVIYRKVIL